MKRTVSSSPDSKPSKLVKTEIPCTPKRPPVSTRSRQFSPDCYRRPEEAPVDNCTRCKICRKVFPKWRQQRIHAVVHYPTHLYKCKLCPVGKNRRPEIERHAKTVHGKTEKYSGHRYYTTPDDEDGDALNEYTRGLFFVFEDESDDDDDY